MTDIPLSKSCFTAMRVQHKDGHFSYITRVNIMLICIKYRSLFDPCMNTLNIVYYVHLGPHDVRLVVVAVGDLLFCCYITLWLYVYHVLSFFSYYVLWAVLPALNA